MAFRDNLLHLRASKNLTQEQLAVMLGVSRQSVTKWESDKSYPEMDKLIKLCQIFDCTLDELVQGDMTGRPLENTPTQNLVPEDVFGYDETMRKFANWLSNGIMTIILSVAVSIVFFGLAEPQDNAPAVLPENIGAAIGIILMIAGIAAGVGLIIAAGMHRSSFVKKHPFLMDFYTDQQKEQARHVFVFSLVAGIAAIAIGVGIQVCFSDTAFEDTVGTPCMLAFIAIGVRFIVHGSLFLGRTNIEGYNKSIGEELSEDEIKNSDIPEDKKEQALSERKKNERIGAICGVIMMVATIIGLVLLFVPTSVGIEWDEPGHYLFWLVWPIGGILCGIVSVLMHAFYDDKR